MANHERGRIRVDSDDTGTFESLHRASRVHVDGRSDTSNMPIYGLEVTKEDRKLIEDRRRILRTVFGCVAAAVALFAILFIVQTLRGRGNAPRETKPEEQTASQSADTTDQPSAVPLTVTPTADDPQLQAANLIFDGTSLQIPQDELEVEIKNGFVQVTHWLSEPVYEANPLVEEAALRAAALTNLIDGRMVIGVDEDQPSTFESVTWIVRNQDGDSYLAIIFPAGGAPSTGDGLSVLVESPRYRLSDSVYYALEVEGDVPQSAGDTPTMLNDEYIWSTAAIAYQ